MVKKEASKVGCPLNKIIFFESRNTLNALLLTFLIITDAIGENTNLRYFT